MILFPILKQSIAALASPALHIEDGAGCIGSGRSNRWNHPDN